MTRRDGSEAVLKLVSTVAEAREETAALRAWAPSGAAVRLLDADPDHGCLLLERLRPGTAMPRDDPSSTSSAAALLAALHAVGPAGSGFRRLAGSFAEHDHEVRADLASERRTRHEPRRAAAAEELLPSAGELMERLAADGAQVLLHGDFLTKNLLRSPDGYRAVDPLPRLGDPCADVGMFASDQSAAGILDTAVELARLLSLDVDRAVSWAAVWTVMVAVQAWRTDQADLDALVTSQAFRGVVLGG